MWIGSKWKNGKGTIYAACNELMHYKCVDLNSKLGIKLCEYGYQISDWENPDKQVNALTRA